MIRRREFEVGELPRSDDRAWRDSVESFNRQYHEKRGGKPGASQIRRLTAGGSHATPLPALPSVIHPGQGERPLLLGSLPQGVQ
jgi:hypothetical protein